jgi:hypothetical protein
VNDKFNAFGRLDESVIHEKLPVVADRERSLRARGGDQPEQQSELGESLTDSEQVLVHNGNLFRNTS